ncbi:MAG: isoprenyl transferase [Alphaproteobacteria bacterium]
MFRTSSKKHPTIPKHVAVIMDGNGRWAKKRGLPRSIGHKKGAESARKIVENASKAGIEFITLFGFSSENWNRPQSEIKELMKLLRHYLRSETAELHNKNAKLSVIGARDSLDTDIIELIENAEQLTQNNTGIHVIIALSYGGKHDIAQATYKIVEEALKNGKVPCVTKIEDMISERLFTRDIPDPDLLIRTSGEQRISNFLLWQCAYTEMFFTETLWPDFDADDLSEALEDYQSRDRRYGAIKQSEG